MRGEPISQWKVCVCNTMIRLHVPAPVYYWVTDRLGITGGWRPLSYRLRRSR